MRAVLMMHEYTKLEECRFCGGKNLLSYLDLGSMALANAFLTEEELSEEKKYPLDVLFCEECSLSQLSIVINPEILFKKYVYRSSISKSFAQHCEELAQTLNREDILKDGALAVDIASNDGCLLRSFKNTGSRVLGVEPAVNLAQIANDSGVETIPEFWSVKVAEQIQKKYGTADIITAFNVFAHVHDCTLFLKAIKKLLSPDGYFILESPHVLDLIKNVEFDTVYHEHLSYLSLKSLASLCKKNGLRIAKVKKYSMHGGSIRLFIEHQERADRSDESLMIRLKEEEGEGLHHFERYKQFGTSVQKIREDLIATLQGIHGDGKIVYGFGASAKGNTLLNYCHLDVRSLRGIFDETP